MYCIGNSNACQHECNKIGKYIESYQNVTLSNNLKNYNDMYLCKVQVISETYLS